MAGNGEPEFSGTSFDVLYRLVLIGDSGVGKTAFLLRFSDNIFNASFISTIGIDFRIKTIEINGKRVKLQIWDTAGQEQFHSIASSYYRNAHGILLMYDISSAESFMHITKWINNISTHAESDVSRMLIGNKCDVEDNMRVIDSDRGGLLSQELNMPFLETSAKENINVEEAFQIMTRMIMEATVDKVVECSSHDIIVTNAKKRTKCCKSSSN